MKNVIKNPLSAEPGNDKSAPRCPDFAEIAKTEGFAKLMAAKSKTAESGCSGGSSCGKCPSKASCSKTKG